MIFPANWEVMSHDFTDSNGIPFKYSTIRQIGHGSFGKVSEAIEIKDGVLTGRPVVVKEVQHPHCNDATLQNVAEKLQRILRIQSLNVTMYYFVDSENVDYGFQMSLRTILVMEYCQLGTLEAYIRQIKLSNDKIKDLIKQILNGLAAIHKHGVIHSDLKTANIVLAYDPNVRYALIAKITDLDDHIPLLASVTRKQEVTSIKGTVMFMSPEMLTGGINGYNIGRKTDMWSMGCVIVELFRKEQAFRFVKVVNGKPSPDILIVQDVVHPEAIRTFVVDGGNPEIPAHCPDVSRTMISRCFNRDPNERPSASFVLESRWFEDSWVSPSTVTPSSKVEEVKPVKSKQEFMLRNPGSIPRLDGDTYFWHRGLHCAAQVLMHHVPHTHFPIHNYKAESFRVKKIIDPGQPVDERYRKVLLRWLLSGTAEGPWPILVRSFRSFLLAPHQASRLSSLISLILPTIGPSLPEVAVWMNNYTTDYEYICEGHARWSTIKDLIDRQEPVIAQVYDQDRPIGKLVRQTAMFGCIDSCPKTYPNVRTVILHGYEGHRQNGLPDKPDNVILTPPGDQMQLMPYETFIERASWISDHELIREVFALSGYVPRQIIYRRRKGCDNGEASDSD